MALFQHRQTFTFRGTAECPLTNLGLPMHLLSFTLRLQRFLLHRVILILSLRNVT